MLQDNSQIGGSSCGIQNVAVYYAPADSGATRYEKLSVQDRLIMMDDAHSANLFAEILYLTGNVGASGKLVYGKTRYKPRQMSSL